MARASSSGNGRYTLGMTRTGPPPDSKNIHSFETKRLRVDLPTAADADDMYALLSGEQRQVVCSTLAWNGPEDLAEIQGWIEKCRTLSFSEWGYHWVLRDRLGAITGEADRVVGAIGTRPVREPGRADVGYWLGAAYWGRGLMREALLALIDLGFSTLEYDKLEAEVFATNERGRRLVEHAGFALEGMVRRSQRKYGKWIDAAIYGMLPPDAQHTPPTSRAS